MTFKGFVAFDATKSNVLNNPNLETASEMRQWVMKINGHKTREELDAEFYIEPAEVYFNRPEDEPFIRQDLDGNDITLAVFSKAKADMIADGLCDESFTYDEYCDQCQDL